MGKFTTKSAFVQFEVPKSANRAGRLGLLCWADYVRYVTEYAPGLDALMARLPLPGDYRLCERFEDVLQRGESALRMVGLIAEGSAGEAVGAAASVVGNPFDRAYYELLERAHTRLAIARSPDTWPEVDAHGETGRELAHARVFPPADEGARHKPSISNGIALHTSLARACESARAELVERDAMLRAWYGHTVGTPLPIAPDGEGPRLLSALGYRLKAMTLPCAGERLHVVALLAVPTADCPQLFASGAGPTVQEAEASAERELLQRLAFLWDEPIPEGPPPFSADVDFHLNYYLARNRAPMLQAFFERGHARFCTTPTQGELPPAAVRFVRLTESTQATVVVRCLSDELLPLHFGQVDADTAHLPPALRIHPVA